MKFTFNKCLFKATIFLYDEIPKKKNNLRLLIDKLKKFFQYIQKNEKLKIFESNKRKRKRYNFRFNRKIFNRFFEELKEDTPFFENY